MGLGVILTHYKPLGPDGNPLDTPAALWRRKTTNGAGGLNVYDSTRPPCARCHDNAA